MERILLPQGPLILKQTRISLTLAFKLCETKSVHTLTHIHERWGRKQQTVGHKEFPAEAGSSVLVCSHAS